MTDKVPAASDEDIVNARVWLSAMPPEATIYAGDVENGQAHIARLIARIEQDRERIASLEADIEKYKRWIVGPDVLAFTTVEDYVVNQTELTATYYVAHIASLEADKERLEGFMVNAAIDLERYGAVVLSHSSGLRARDVASAIRYAVGDGAIRRAVAGDETTGGSK